MTVDLGALSALIAKDISEIPDPPSFKVPPCGTYTWLIEKIESKSLGQGDKAKPAIVCTYVINDIIEQTETDISESEQVKPGDKFGESFFFGDPEKADETISWMKARFAGLSEATGSTDLLEIVTKAEGMLVKGIIGHRVDKTDKSKIYPTIRDVVPAM